MSSSETPIMGTGAPSPGSIHLHHAGIDVDDIAAQTAFYRNGFGLSIQHEATLPGFRFTFVLLGSPAGWAIELFKREGAAPRPLPDDPDGQHDILGIGHVCFTVPDVRVAHDHLVMLGAKSRIAPTQSPVPGVGLAYLADPEGNLIELLSENWEA